MELKMENTELRNNLDYLGLPYLRDEFLSLANDAVKKKIHFREFFENAIAGEVAHKRERAIDRRIQQAHFPNKKSLSSFDWSHPSKINEELVRFVFNLDFAGKRGNVAFLGVTGVGKTHLMSALGLHACEKGYSVLFDTAANMINRLVTAQATGDIVRSLKTYSRPDILCVDEIGYLPIGQLEANLFFQVISSRYETGSIVLTSNIAFVDWAKVFNNDSALTSAILDRILHHCDVITIEGSSYRLQDRNK